MNEKFTINHPENQVEPGLTKDLAEANVDAQKEIDNKNQERVNYLKFINEVFSKLEETVNSEEGKKLFYNSEDWQSAKIKLSSTKHQEFRKNKLNQGATVNLYTLLENDLKINVKEVKPIVNDVYQKYFNGKEYDLKTDKETDKTPAPRIRNF
jgi:hypothetical protein